MSPAIKQLSTDWIGSDEKFKEFVAKPLQVEQSAQERLETLPRKDGSPPHLIALKERSPPPEDRVTTVVPENPPSPRFKWTTNFTPPCFPALVNITPYTLLQQADTSLSVTREVVLATVVWDPIITLPNNEDTPLTDSHQVTIGLWVKNGEEASKAVDERNSFNGLTVKYGGSEHSFSEEETQAPHQVEIHYTVPPNTTIYGYQRKYLFIFNLWFQVNTNDDKGHTVGPDNSPIRASISTTIRTEEILFTEASLKVAAGPVNVEAIDPSKAYGKELVDVKKISETVENIVKSTKQKH